MRAMLAAALAGLALAVPARAAADALESWHDFRADEAISVDPAKAYLLVRTIELFGFRFARIEGDDGAAVRRDDLAELNGWVSIDKSFPGQVHLIEVRPGTYWLYGQKTDAYLDGPWLNCLCMGTLRFEAKAGTITDLGTIRDIAFETRGGKRPDRRGQNAGFRPTRDQRAIVVEPAAADAPVPAILGALPRQRAVYRAAGWLPNIDGTRIDRISAIPGIIAYDRDRVIDPTSGRTFR